MAFKASQQEIKRPAFRRIKPFPHPSEERYSSEDWEILVIHHKRNDKGRLFKRCGNIITSPCFPTLGKHIVPYRKRIKYLASRHSFVAKVFWRIRFAAELQEGLLTAATGSKPKAQVVTTQPSLSPPSPYLELKCFISFMQTALYSRREI